MLLNIISRLTKQKPRPPGPSLWDATEIFKGDDVFVNLEYPLKLMQKYGPISRFPFAKNTYIITGAKEMEEILKTKVQHFNKDNFLYRRLHLLFGKSLLVTDGSYWKHRRKISQPAFQMAMIKNYATVMTDICQALLQELQQNPPRKVNIVSLMNATTLKITCQLFCGETISHKTLSTLGKSIYFSNWYLTHTLFIRAWKPTLNNIRFYYVNHQVNKIFLAMIQRRRAQIELAKQKEHEGQERQEKQKKQKENELGKEQAKEQLEKEQPQKDLLQMLIEARNEQDTAFLSDQEILNEWKTLILTGHETTAAGLTWMWYLLAKYPYYRSRLEEELAEVLGGRIPTLEDLPKLNILRAIICETFRLYPPIWSVFRSNTEADIICGYHLPAKSLFILNFFALHRNPEHWENPNEFYPPRFLGEAQKNQSPFSYLPFSSGPRICIASHFAMIETMLMAATLAQKIRFELLPNAEVFPEPCISLRPKGNLWMTITPR